MVHWTPLSPKNVLTEVTEIIVARATPSGPRRLSALQVPGDGQPADQAPARRASDKPDNGADPSKDAVEPEELLVGM